MCCRRSCDDWGESTWIFSKKAKSNEFGNEALGKQTSGQGLIGFSDVFVAGCGMAQRSQPGTLNQVPIKGCGGRNTCQRDWQTRLRVSVENRISDAQKSPCFASPIALWRFRGVAVALMHPTISSSQLRKIVAAQKRPQINPPEPSPPFQTLEKRPARTPWKGYKFECEERS